MYAACDKAEQPRPPFPASDLVEGLLVFIYMSTGWRIGATLALRREDVDLEMHGSFSAR